MMTFQFSLVSWYSAKASAQRNNVYVVEMVCTMHISRIFGRPDALLVMFKIHYTCFPVTSS